MANHSGNHGDGKIRDGKNVAQGEGQGLSLSVRQREFAHQQIGIKEEDDKRNLNQGAPDPGERPAILWFRIAHETIISAVAERTSASFLVAGPSFGNKAVAHPGLGLDVLLASFGFELFAHLAYKNAQVFRLMGRLRSPNCGQ